MLAPPMTARQPPVQHAKSPRELADMLILSALQSGGSPAAFECCSDGTLVARGADALGAGVGPVRSAAPPRPTPYPPPPSARHAPAQPRQMQHIQPAPGSMMPRSGALDMAAARLFMQAQIAPHQFGLIGGGLGVPSVVAKAAAAQTAPALPDGAYAIMRTPPQSWEAGSATASPATSPQRPAKGASRPLVRRAPAPLQPAPPSEPQPMPHVPPLSATAPATAPATATAAAPTAPKAARLADPQERACPHCRVRGFSSTEDLLAHAKACSTTFSCSCSLRFPTRAKLMRHCHRCGHEPWRPTAPASVPPLPSVSSMDTASLLSSLGSGADAAATHAAEMRSTEAPAQPAPQLSSPPPPLALTDTASFVSADTYTPSGGTSPFAQPALTTDTPASTQPSAQNELSDLISMLDGDDDAEILSFLADM